MLQFPLLSVYNYGIQYDFEIYIPFSLRREHLRGKQFYSSGNFNTFHWRKKNISVAVLK